MLLLRLMRRRVLGVRLRSDGGGDAAAECWRWDVFGCEVRVAAAESSAWRFEEVVYVTTLQMYIAIDRNRARKCKSM